MRSGREQTDALGRILRTVSETSSISPARLLRAMNGALTIESTEQRGTRVAMTLPAARPDQGE